MKKTATKKKTPAKMDDAAIAEFYDNQSDADVVAEIESAINDPQTVMVQIPRSLLPDVLKLIDKKKKSA
jgi:hypothetical protein